MFWHKNNLKPEIFCCSNSTPEFDVIFHQISEDRDNDVKRGIVMTRSPYVIPSFFLNWTTRWNYEKSDFCIRKALNYRRGRHFPNHHAMISLLEYIAEINMKSRFFKKTTLSNSKESFFNILGKMNIKCITTIQTSLLQPIYTINTN